jgi:hypothetical protein
MTTNVNNYPVYAYRYEILSIFSGNEPGNPGILIKYIPENANLTSLSFNIPILYNFDINNMAEYVENWAPHPQWFAQEIVLNYSETIMTSSTANTVFEN